MGLIASFATFGVGFVVPLGIYAFVLALITLGSTFITPETQGRDLTRIQDALVDARAGVAVEG